MNFKQFRKNTKAISPIFATLILIAIAVIAGVVVYMFVSGTLSTMTGGGAAAQEKVAIQSATYDSTTHGITIYATCSSGPLPTVNGMIIKDTQGNTIGNAALATGTGFTEIGALDDITGVLDITTAGTYTVTLTTAAGGSFVSPSFVV
jgi:flagellin-like protein